MASNVQTGRVMIMVAVVYTAATSCSSDKSLIESVCEPSRDREFCVKSLESDPEAMKAKDTMGVLKATVEMIIRNTTSFVEVEEMKFPVMRKCGSIYDRLVKNLHMILGELSEDLQTASLDMYAAGDFLDECENLASHDPVVVANNKFIRRLR